MNGSNLSQSDSEFRDYFLYRGQDIIVSVDTLSSSVLSHIKLTNMGQSVMFYIQSLSGSVADWPLTFSLYVESNRLYRNIVSCSRWRPPALDQPTSLTCPTSPCFSQRAEHKAAWVIESNQYWWIINNVVCVTALTACQLASWWAESITAHASLLLKHHEAKSMWTGFTPLTQLIVRLIKRLKCL